MNWEERYLREAGIKSKFIEKGTSGILRAVGVPKTVAQGLGAAAGGLSEGQTPSEAIGTGLNKSLKDQGGIGRVIQKGLQRPEVSDVIDGVVDRLKSRRPSTEPEETKPEPEIDFLDGFN